MRAKAVAAAFLALAAPASARAAGDPAIAALQSALRARGLYAGAIDGVRGPATSAAVVRAQRHAALAADGIVGPLTRRALRLRALGSRTLRRRLAGTDVVALQFALSEHGFPCGTIDGEFGARTERALQRFQRSAGLSADGVAGRQTFGALRAPARSLPFSLAWPVAGVVTDGFGPRGGRFHTGIDIPASMGAGVRAAAPGRVAYAAELAGGWGLLVSIAHGGGVRTLYAHLSRIDVRVGQWVQTGSQVGLVGATGDATGPHLHFEVRVGGAAVDPLPAL